MRLTSVLSVGLCALLLTSCGIAARSRASSNNEKLLSLRMGMTPQEVQAEMGKPDLNEAYQSLHGKPIIIYFYDRAGQWRTHSKETCTPVVFEDGRLIGWGDEFYRKVQDVNVNITNR